MKKTSFRELANRAGVSTATVTRIARGQANVDPELRNRVHQAALELGIDLAQRRDEKSTIVAFLLGNRTVLHQFQAHVLSGAESYCSSQQKEPSPAPAPGPAAPPAPAAAAAPARARDRRRR